LSKEKFYSAVPAGSETGLALPNLIAQAHTIAGKTIIMPVPEATTLAETP
jgi:hypothetical protein